MGMGPVSAASSCTIHRAAGASGAADDEALAIAFWSNCPHSAREPVTGTTTAMRCARRRPIGAHGRIGGYGRKSLLRLPGDRANKAVEGIEVSTEMVGHGAGHRFPGDAERFRWAHPRK